MIDGKQLARKKRKEKVKDEEEARPHPRLLRSEAIEKGR